MADPQPFGICESADPACLSPRTHLSCKLCAAHCIAHRQGRQCKIKSHNPAAPLAVVNAAGADTCSHEECTGKRDDPCTHCADHCKNDDCTLIAHLRKQRDASRKASHCPLDRTQVANDHDGICPCGAIIKAHPKAGKKVKKDPADIAAAAAAAAEAACYIAVKFGISAKYFAVHPVSLSFATWQTYLDDLVGESAEDRKRSFEKDKTERKAKQAKATNASEGLNMMELSRRCDFPGLKTRSIAGLLAVSSCLATHNTISPTALTILRNVLCEGDKGAMPAEDALSDPLVTHFHRSGREWFVKLAIEIRKTHRCDTPQYIKYDKEKSKKKAIIWPDRFTRLRFGGYCMFFDTRTSSWNLDSLPNYLTTKWDVRVTDSALPEDQTAEYVQIGVLAELEKAKRFEVMGDSLNAVRSHYFAAYAAFHAKHVLSVSNLGEWKRYIDGGGEPPGREQGKGLPTAKTKQPFTPKPGADRGRSRFGGGPFDSHAGPLTGLQSMPLTPAPQPPQRATGPPGPHALSLQTVAGLVANRQGAVRAGTVPQANGKPGITPDTPVWTRCVAPECRSVAPQGFSLSPVCIRHNPAPPQRQGTR
jgi:hypothetical protein